MGAKPHLKWGAGVKATQFRLFLCLYRTGSLVVEAFQPFFFSPPKTPGSCLLGGWKGFAQVFIDSLGLITPKAWLEGFCSSLVFIDNHTKSTSHYSDF